MKTLLQQANEFIAALPPWLEGSLVPAFYWVAVRVREKHQKKEIYTQIKFP